MDFTHIKFDVSDEIATITLFRPDARNALSAEMRDDLRAALKVVKDQAGEEIKALILTGAGGAFCAGGDIKGMGSNERTSLMTRKGLRSDHALIYDIANIELPVVSLVDGPAAGAGCNLALAADFWVGFFQVVFVADGLRLDIFDGDGAALAVILVQEVFVAALGQDLDQLFGQVDAVVDAAVHAHAAQGVVHVGTIAGQQDAPVAVGFGNPLVDPIDGQMIGAVLAAVRHQAFQFAL